jgi:hypothetical protein
MSASDVRQWISPRAVRLLLWAMRPQPVGSAGTGSTRTSWQSYLRDITLASLDGEIAHAGEYAWGECMRNSLGVHASAFPNQWDSIVGVDDVCTSYYDLKNQGILGLPGIRSIWEGQLTEQPSLIVMGLLTLAGLQPTPSGFVIDPQLPTKYFNVQFPMVGLSRSKKSLRGLFQS